MLSDLYILEPELMRWSRPTTNGKMPRPRAGHTCTAIGPVPQSQSERTAAVQNVAKSSDEASPRRNEEENYSSPRSLPNGSLSLAGAINGNTVAVVHVQDEAAIGLGEMNGAIAIQPSQRLLFFGGGDNEGFMNDLHLLEIDTLTWSPVFTAGSSPSPRSRHSASLVKSTLWVIGGLGEGQNVFNDVYTLNTSSLVWSKPTLKGNPMSPRWGHSAIRSGSLIIIFGGHNGVEVMSDLHILDTDSASWRSIEMGVPSLSGSLLMPSTPIPVPLVELPPVVEIEGESSSSPTSAGSSNSTLSSSTNTSSDPSVPSHTTSIVSSTATGSPSQANTASIGSSSTSNPTGNLNGHSIAPIAISSINSNVGHSTPPTPRCGHSANFLLLGRERKMVVFGGSNTGGDVFNDTFVLDLDTFIWSTLNIQGSLPHARSVHSCNTVEDKLFVIGGIDSVRRFKDIYTLSLSSVIHPIAEDPSMVPLRSSGRPRRSSRASPRVVSLSSPTSNASPSSPSVAGNSSMVNTNTGSVNAFVAPIQLQMASIAINSNSSPNAIPISPTSYHTSYTPSSGNTGLQTTLSGAGTTTHHQTAPVVPTVITAAQPTTPNSASSSSSSSGGIAPISFHPPNANSFNSSFATSPVPHPLQTRRSNEELMRSSDPTHLVANGGPLSVHIPPNFLDTGDEGRLSPLASYGSVSASHSSPLRQRPGNSLRRSANGTNSTFGPAFSPSASGHPSSFMGPHMPSSLHSAAPLPDSPFSLQSQPYDPLSQTRYNKSASSSMESLPSLSSMAIFLSNIGLGRLIAKFESEEIDMSVLPYLTEENMEYLGVNTLGSRLRLSNAIQALKVTHISKTSSNNSHLPQTYGSQSPIPSHQTTMEPLEAAIERLVTTVLVATNTLTDTMLFITTKLNNAQPTNSPTNSNSGLQTPQKPS